MIAVIASTGSNFASVDFALRRLGAESVVTEDPTIIATASHVILPGVGSAQTGMSRLKAAGLTDVVRNLTQPVLGICLGMQLMFEYSQEGETEGLGVFRGVVKKLDPGDRLPVPHMGWNTVDFSDAGDDSATSPNWAYFVHSYAAAVGPDTIATTSYTAPFTSVARRDNYTGVQFHPERSAEFGSAILKNFVAQTWKSILQ